MNQQQAILGMLGYRYRYEQQLQKQAMHCRIGATDKIRNQQRTTNARIRKNGMGDIGMIKGVCLPGCSAG